MQGGQVLGQNISNKEAGRGGAKATRADSPLAYVSESAQNYGKNEAQNRKTDKAILQGLTDVGVQISAQDLLGAATEINSIFIKYC